MSYLRQQLLLARIDYQIAFDDYAAADIDETGELWRLLKDAEKKLHRIESELLELAVHEQVSPREK